MICWRGQEAQSFGIVSAFTELVKPLFNCPGVPEAQQIDIIKKIETPDLPPNDIRFLEGDAFILLRNIGTRSGFIKGRRCRAMRMKNRTLVFQFKNGEPMTLTKTHMEKTSNGMEFIGRQLLLLLIFAGAVHRSQGMTLRRAVLDCRLKF
jgi:hypothetical protein